jgi:hypothetical protein
MRRVATWLLPTLCFGMGNGWAAVQSSSAPSEPTPSEVAAAATASRSSVSSIAPHLLDSPAATQIKKLPKDVVNARQPRRFSQAAEREQAMALDRNIDEIRVVADRDPDDVVRRVAPFDEFRNRMENDRRMTPADIAKFGLCFFGLCGANYGPDGAPVESKAFTRSEAAKARSTLELGRVRGTVQ